jgi:hypothetical protein
VLVHPSAFDLSSSHLRFLACELTTHRRRIGSRWRRPDPRRQALLVLAHLRCGDTYTRLAARFGIGLATVRRYIYNVQVLADPAGRLLWTSPALPGSAHDLTAARAHGIIDALAGADIPCWADKAYRGASGPVRVSYHGKWHNLLPGQQAVNRSHARIRALGERSVSILNAWRLLRRLRCSTTRITDLTRAVLTLHLNAG